MGDALSSSDLFASVVYEDQLACSLLEKASEKSPDPKKKPALWLSLQAYNRVPASKLGLEAKQTAWYSLLVGGKKVPTVAVVPLSGQIFGGDGKSNSPRIFAEPAIAAIREVAERKDVAAVVLRVDSPGGDALASELIWRAACLLGTTKPVVASMGSVAASGGYFIPMAAHRKTSLLIYQAPAFSTDLLYKLLTTINYTRCLRPAIHHHRLDRCHLREILTGRALGEAPSRLDRCDHCG